MKEHSKIYKTVTYTEAELLDLLGISNGQWYVEDITFDRMSMQSYTATENHVIFRVWSEYVE